METSIYLAKILGPIYLVMSLSVLFNYKRYIEIYEDFSHNAAFAYFGGLVALIIGMLIITSHNYWVQEWPVIITLLGWISTVKGVCILIFPDQMIETFRPLKTDYFYYFWAAIICLALGTFFTYVGYWI